MLETKYPWSRSEWFYRVKYVTRYHERFTLLFGIRLQAITSKEFGNLLRLVEVVVEKFPQVLDHSVPLSQSDYTASATGSNFRAWTFVRLVVLTTDTRRAVHAEDITRLSALLLKG